MTKFTKISATALFALFLTACDKPAPKTAETPAAPATETAAPATQQATPAATDEIAQGKADLEKVLAWDSSNQAEIAKLQQDLQQAKDPKAAEEALNAFTGKIAETIKSLEALDIKNTQVAEFRNQAKEVLVLSQEVIVDSLKFAANQDDKALGEAIQGKVTNLVTKSQALQSVQTKLKAEFDVK